MWHRDTNIRYIDTQQEKKDTKKDPKFSYINFIIHIVEIEYDKNRIVINE